MRNETTITFPSAAKVRGNTVAAAEMARKEEINEFSRRVIAAICAASGRGEFFVNLHAPAHRIPENSEVVEEVAEELRARGFAVNVPTEGTTQLSIHWSKP